MTSLVELTRTALVDHSLSGVESRLVDTYCRYHSLTPRPGSPVLEEIQLAKKSTLPSGFFDNAASFKLDDLVACFETLVPQEEAKRFGAVFTPPAITAFMAKEAVNRAVATGFDAKELTAIDPAVGCGALLVAVLETIVDQTGQAPSDVAARLTGIDISKNSVRRASILISLACLTLGDDKTPQPHLAVGDALVDDLNQLLAGRVKHTITIANPPYVRYQVLPYDVRARLARDWVSCANGGNFNLYFPFFELTQKTTCPHGVFALITPNGFFASLSGAALRGWLIDQNALQTIVDFGHHRVFDALTYTAITFGQIQPDTNNLQPNVAYMDVDDVSRLAKLPQDWQDTKTTVYHKKDLTSRPWRLVGPARRKSIETVRSAGKPLSHFADVRFGVATCRDRLFFLSGDIDDEGRYVTRHNNTTYTIEPEFTRPCFKVSKLSNKKELKNAATRIIYPYKVTNNMAVVYKEAEVKNRFPHAFSYLTAIRPELEKRDRGRKTYPAWFAYGRTQGLVPAGKKLLTPLYAARPRFLRDDSKESLFINGCAVVPHKEADIEILELVLNSGVCHYYIESTATAIDGGFFAYQKKQLQSFSIPDFTNEQVSELLSAPSEKTTGILAGIYGLDLPDSYQV